MPPCALYASLRSLVCILCSPVCQAVLCSPVCQAVLCSPVCQAVLCSPVCLPAPCMPPCAALYASCAALYARPSGWGQSISTYTTCAHMHAHTGACTPLGACVVSVRAHAT
ncbi:hypothetical protein DUNSADRAFT_10001 [Dunaliella salina]|uniref:Secreted protein n=1 Tax=Dunaliella salina TaxID=3046 RepID=A0ABQ7GGA0_DUNSA|nr:hypothetical protein DUNSADRAFT_10001 [Dunaliella salina]|eukprot:KAF5833623.1 hypothetical protein DUNSADRAFT_10001 [Dunaliella salina]